MCDVDHFKDFNDRHGHKCGDHILIEVSQFLKNGVRKGDLVARWGVLLLIILPNTRSKMPSKSQKQYDVSWKTSSMPVTPRSGSQQVLSISEINGQVLTDEALLQADKSLYVAKQNGRNQGRLNLLTA